MVGLGASLALAAVAVLTARAFDRAAARARVLTASFGLCLMVAPLAWLVAELRPPAAPPAAAETLLSGTAVPLLGAALLIAAVLLVELVLDVVRLRHIKRRALPVGETGVRGAPIGVSARVGSPTAIGYLHPAIVVPAGFRRRVDEGEWRAVLQHECAHLRRYDDWAKALQSVFTRAGWWLPGLWILGRALDLERELASDEDAAAAGGAHRYAACLLRLATVPAADDAALALWNRRSHVAIRVERLLRPAVVLRPLARALGVAAGAAGTVAVLGVTLLAVPAARAPQVAERPVQLAVLAPPHRRLRIAHHRPHARPAHRARPVQLAWAKPPAAALPRPAAHPALAPAPPSVPRASRPRRAGSLAAAAAPQVAALPPTPRRSFRPQAAVVRDAEAIVGSAGGAPSVGPIATDESDVTSSAAPRSGAAMIRLSHPPSP
ncbi:MAG TPA: M56 family metallopeptidase [Candidatus Sulfotelmatobacter sp.]|nr:M56 family metallopeptidase [Candidatus Sulfotelmatobacter sp.]